MPGFEIRPVGADDLDLAERFFDGRRATRRCWCTAFCSTRRQFAAGWFGGGNQRRFGAMARRGPHPMGLLAVRDGEPVGWCACGPRSRYLAAVDGRSGLLVGQDRAEDDDVWLVACLVVRPGEPAAAAVTGLVRAAVDLAGDRGAAAVEAWPLATGVRGPATLHVGREGVFAREGFRCVRRVADQRVLMRLDLPGTRHP